MKFIIIGNGIAGVTAAQNLRKEDKEAEITIISDENEYYYSRPRLIEVFEEKVDYDGIIVNKQQWYDKNNINLIKGKKVINIDKEQKQVLLADDMVLAYDKLLLAVGSRPFVPPINGATSCTDLFVLRTMQQAKEIQNKCTGKNIAVIGGGLLGLELAASLMHFVKSVKVIEFAEHLLPRQLEKEKSLKLQAELEKKGLEFVLGTACQSIEKSPQGLKICSSTANIECDMIIVSAGVRPRLELAQKAGIETNKGIVVNELLKTTDDNIFAAGDCIEMNSNMWGFVITALNQGKIAAANMLGKQTEYMPKPLKIKLKVSGIDIEKL